MNAQRGARFLAGQRRFAVPTASRPAFRQDATSRSTANGEPKAPASYPSSRPGALRREAEA